MNEDDINLNVRTGETCPKCGGTEVDNVDEDAGEKEHRTTVVCEADGTTWTAVFRFAYIEDVNAE